jgi:hypothetical protein
LHPLDDSRLLTPSSVTEQDRQKSGTSSTIPTELTTFHDITSNQ